MFDICAELREALPPEFRVFRDDGFAVVEVYSFVERNDESSNRNLP